MGFLSFTLLSVNQGVQTLGSGVLVENHAA